MSKVKKKRRKVYPRRGWVMQCQASDYCGTQSNYLMPDSECEKECAFFFPTRKEAKSRALQCGWQKIGEYWLCCLCKEVVLKKGKE